MLGGGRRGLFCFVYSVIFFIFIFYFLENKSTQKKGIPPVEEILFAQQKKIDL